MSIAALTSVVLALFFASDVFISVNAQCTTATRPLNVTNNGTILSPNYPLNYPASSNCQWLLIASDSDYVIGLRFSYFATESSYDYVSLYNGPTTASPQIARLTGQTVALSTSYLSSQRFMLVIFTSDSSVQYAGFAANFTSLTGTRLVGNSTAREGRVEVYNDGTWGTVCDDFFTDTNARVACFSMGYGYVGRFLYNKYGPGTGSIWLDDVACTGTETSLGDCRNRGWGIHNCAHSEDTSISCALELRLVGNAAQGEGRLEVLYNNEWGTVCADAFATVDAQVACYSLGYGYVGRLLGYQYGAGTGPIWLDDVGCRGTEGTLADCPNNGWGVHNCNHYQDVSIACTLATATTPSTILPQTTAAADVACSPDSRPLRLTGYSGTISSQNFPNDYNNNADCQWLIQSTEAIGFVRLDFTYFYTETCCDYVFVHDGDTTKDPRIASLSGAYSTPPGGLNSTRRYMLVRFISDTDFTAGGFSATYTSVAPPITACGSLLRPSPNGTAVAPGWGPSCYISRTDTAYVNTECRELIQNLPGIGDFNELLGRSGNFGCGTSTRDDFLGADYVCQDDFQQTLTLDSQPAANKLIVCIRLPPSK